MAQAISFTTRHQIVQLHLEGQQSLTKIAQRLGLNYYSVRQIWRHYRDQGDRGLEPKYGNCGPRKPYTSALVQRSACFLKYYHRAWGAPYIRALLKERFADRGLHIPTGRQMQRWFRKAGLKLPKSKRPKPVPKWAKSPLEALQIDAKEKVPIASGQRICWLTITDEFSNGLLTARAFPPQADLPGESC